MRKAICAGGLFVLAAAFVLGVLSAVPAQAQNGPLMINLVIHDERILVYAGTTSGIQVGERFSVIRDGEKVGTIRIGLFMGEIHPALCEAARADLALADDAVCDDACRDSVTMNVMDRMTAAL